MKRKHFFLLVLLILATVCATYNANSGPGAEERKMQRRVFTGSYDEVYRVVMQTAASQKWEITHSDKDAGLVQAKTPKSLSSWDDEVSIAMNEVNGGIQVQVNRVGTI